MRVPHKRFVSVTLVLMAVVTLLRHNGVQAIGISSSGAGVRLTHASLVERYDDDFEGVAINPFWVVTERYGTVTLSTAQSHNGSQSVAFSSTSGGQRDMRLTHDFPSPVVGDFSVYFYDAAPGQETLYERLTLYNSAQPNAVASIGTQDYDASCYTAYVVDAGGSVLGPNANCGVHPDVRTTDVPRTLGWHLLRISVLDNMISFAIDGQQVFSTGGEFSFDRVELSVSGPYWRPDTTAYFDDFSFVPPAGCFSPIGTVTLSFDEVSAPPGCVDATEYLSGFGITFEPITPGAAPAICDQTFPDSATTPSSPPNIFAAGLPVTNTAVSYRLNFCTPLSSISFTRCAIQSVSTGPPWTASALNAQGDVVATVSEGRTVGPPARRFTLAGPGITSLRVDADNTGASTFNHPPFDDLTLVAQSRGTTVGAYVPSSSAFFLRNNNSPGPADLAFRYGPAGAGWVPLAGDWDGDGTDTPGLYAPASSSFFLTNTSAPGPADLVYSFGPAGTGWTPLAGDWDGDGRDTVGLYVPATAISCVRNTTGCCETLRSPICRDRSTASP
jgi:hypothetical protein